MTDNCGRPFFAQNAPYERLFRWSAWPALRALCRSPAEATRIPRGSVDDFGAPFCRPLVRPRCSCFCRWRRSSPTVRAQDASTEDRLDRLERDLSMLQRQVYRGTGGEAPPGAEGGSAAVDLQVRMDRLEQQMRDLTGRVEDETNQVQQLRQRLEQVNSDIDVRLGEGQGQDAGAAPPTRTDASAQASEPPPLAEPALTPYGRPPPSAAARLWHADAARRAAHAR